MILLTVFYLVLKKIYTDENNVVVFNVGLFEIVFVFLQDLIIIVFTNKRRKEICSLISKYAILERLTNKLKKCKSTYHVQVRNTIMKIVLVEFVLTIICCVVDCVNNPNEGVNTVVYFTLWSFHFYYELVILTFLEVLLNQYRELANYMIKKNRCSEKKLKEVLKIYLFIRQIFHLTKKYFQGIILAKTLTDLFISTTGIYYHIRMMVHNENKNYISKYGLASTWLVLISISNFIVVYFCQIITQQDKLIENLILNNMIDTFLDYKMRTLYVLHGDVDKLDVTVCGLFPLNNTLIGWMVANILTYVIYLIQL
ncbi:unnamed protein product, partial [Tenebrio molitor]